MELYFICTHSHIIYLIPLLCDRERKSFPFLFVLTVRKNCRTILGDILLPQIENTHFCVATNRNILQRYTRFLILVVQVTKKHEENSFYILYY